MTLTTFHKLRPFSIGFDSLFDDFDRLLDTLLLSYPPYNLIKSKDGDNYKIQLALVLVGLKILSILK